MTEVYTIAKPNPSHDRRRLHTTKLLETFGQITLSGSLSYPTIFPTPKKLGMKKKVISLHLEMNAPTDWVYRLKPQLANNGTSISIQIMQLYYEGIVENPADLPITVDDLRFNQVFPGGSSYLESSDTDPQIFARKVFGNMFKLVANLGTGNAGVVFDSGDSVDIQDDATAGIAGDIPIYVEFDVGQWQSLNPFTIRVPTVRGEIIEFTYQNTVSDILRFHAATSRFSSEYDPEGDAPSVYSSGKAQWGDNQTGIYVANLKVSQANLRKLKESTANLTDLNTYLALHPIVINFTAVGQ